MASVDLPQPWMRCANVAWLLAASAMMVLYLSATAFEALALRLRIQKQGKRYLNWNQKPMTAMTPAAHSSRFDLSSSKSSSKPRLLATLMP